jgi:hypothetical protein
MFGTTKEAMSDIKMTEERTIKYLKYWLPEYSEVSENGLNFSSISRSSSYPYPPSLLRPYYGPEDSKFSACSTI